MTSRTSSRQTPYMSHVTMARLLPEPHACPYTHVLARATLFPAQSSRRLPTSVARDRARVSSCGIYGSRSETTLRLTRVLLFHLSTTSPTVPHEGRYNRPNSGRRAQWNRSQPAPRKEEIHYTEIIKFLCERMRYHTCQLRVGMTSQVSSNPLCTTACTAHHPQPTA